MNRTSREPVSLFCREIITGLLFIFFLYSCKTGSILPSSSQSETKLLFVSVKLQKTENEEIKMELINKKWTDGHLKKRSVNRMSSEILCEFLDSNKKETGSVTAVNPLSKIIEYYAEDGTIAKKLVELDEGIVVIRAKAPTNTQYLRISSTDPEFSGIIDLK